MYKDCPKHDHRVNRQSTAQVVGRQDRSQTANGIQDEGIPALEMRSRRDTDPGRGKNVLLTGGTGFVGDLLIKKYLKRTDCNLWILSRPARGVPASERILDRIESREHHRIRVLEGDLARDNGEDADDSSHPSGVIDRTKAESYDSFREMIEVVDEVFHNGSYLGLGKSSGERQKCMDVNYEGTKRLLNLVTLFKQELKALFYTSTAFVHGRITEPEEFGEDDGLTNGWLNPYEESKWKAEELIRNAGYPYRIFRPGMIAREPGVDILSSHTMYGVANVLESGYKSFRTSASNGPLHVRVKGIVDAAHNIILRSELVDMMFDIRASKHQMNHTYNTLNTSNTRLEDVLYSILYNLNPKITYEFVSDLDYNQELNRMEVLLERAVYPMYEGYLFKKSPEFGMDNVIEALGERYVEDRITKMDRPLLTKLMEDHFLTKRKI